MKFVAVGLVGKLWRLLLMTVQRRGKNSNEEENGRGNSRVNLQSYELYRNALCVKNKFQACAGIFKVNFLQRLNYVQNTKINIAK